MWRHCQDKHGGRIDSPQKDFTFKVLKSYRNSLNRVLGEAANILEMMADPKRASLNSRTEYCSPQIVRPIFVKGPGM